MQWHKQALLLAIKILNLKLSCLKLSQYKLSHKVLKYLNPPKVCRIIAFAGYFGGYWAIFFYQLMGSR